MTKLCRLPPQVQNMTLLICPSCCPSCPLFPRLACVFCAFFYCLELNLLLKTFLRICKLFPCLAWAHNTNSDFATTVHLGTVFSDAMLHNRTHTAHVRDAHRPDGDSDKARGIVQVSWLGCSSRGTVDFHNTDRFSAESLIYSKSVILARKASIWWAKNGNFAGHVWGFKNVGEKRAGWRGAVWWNYTTAGFSQTINPLAPNDIYIYIYVVPQANLQTLHFKYLLNKYTYWIF